MIFFNSFEKNEQIVYLDFYKHYGPMKLCFDGLSYKRSLWTNSANWHTTSYLNIESNIYQFLWIVAPRTVLQGSAQCSHKTVTFSYLGHGWLHPQFFNLLHIMLCTKSCRIRYSSEAFITDGLCSFQMVYDTQVGSLYLLIWKNWLFAWGLNGASNLWQNILQNLSLI